MVHNHAKGRGHRRLSFKGLTLRFGMKVQTE